MMVAPVGYVNHSTIDNVTDFSYNVLAIEGHDVTPDSPLPCPSSGISIYSEFMLFCQVITCFFQQQIYRRAVRMPTQIVPAASLRSTTRLPAARALVRASNHLIWIVLWSIGRAISRVASNFLPALREGRAYQAAPAGVPAPCREIVFGAGFDLIGVVGEHRVDRAAPPGAVIFEQLFGRGASAAGDREKRVEEMRLVLAGGAAARSPMQAFARDLEHFERDVAQGAGPERCGKPEARHVAPHRLPLLGGPIRDEIVGCIKRHRIVEDADPQCRERAQPAPWAAIGAAHLEKRLQPNLGECGRQMVGPIADSRDLTRKCRQPSGKEIAKGLAARINVMPVAVDKVHRHIEQVVDIALETETLLEDERQGAAPIGVGIGPHDAAMAEEARGPAFNKGGIGEQRHRDRLEREADTEFLHHVGLGAIVEIGLHGTGAQHHVETEPALFRHVIAADRLVALGLERYSLPPPFRIEAEPDHAEPELVANLAHLAEMLMDLIAGLMDRLERGAAQLELATRLERDRTSSIIGQRDGIAVFEDRLPTEAGHLSQQRADSGRPFIGHPAQIGTAKNEFFVLGADPPRSRRLAAPLEVFDELPLVRDRRSWRARRGGHARQNSQDKGGDQRLRVRRQSPAVAW